MHYDPSNPFLTQRQRTRGRMTQAMQAARTRGTRAQTHQAARTRGTAKPPIAFAPLNIPATEPVTESSTTLVNLDAFATAGRAIFTIENVASGHHVTYRVSACENKTDLFFVAVLTGPENTTEYTYLGTIRQGQYAHGKKSTISEMATSNVVFAKVWAKRAALPNCVRVYHEGRCGKCGRRLTTPESIQKGYGDVCEKSVIGAAQGA